MRKCILPILFFTLLFFLTSNLSYAEIAPTSAVSSNSFSQLTSPTPIPPSTNPFNYTPLPAISGPENDIVETSPLAASRNVVQVDDSVTFSVTIQNRASYNKMLESLCFESTDGNFGCLWGISLAPGQSFTINNVGTWTSGGTKDVWITWSQDGINYYQPLGATHVHITVLG